MQNYLAGKEFNGASLKQAYVNSPMIGNLSRKGLYVFRNLAGLCTTIVVRSFILLAISAMKKNKDQN